MQWDFFSSERHWRKFDMHSFKVRHSFLSASLGLRVWYPWAGLSDYFCFCSCNLFVFSCSPPGPSVIIFFSIPFGVSVFGLTGRFQSGKLRRSQTFTGCFLPVIRDLFYESDLTQWSFFLCPWDRDTEQSECLIALFYKLYEYFMYFGPACGFWSETQRKTVWKREHLLFSQCVWERRRTHARFCNSSVLV